MYNSKSNTLALDVVDMKSDTTKAVEKDYYVNSSMNYNGTDKNKSRKAVQTGENCKFVHLYILWIVNVYRNNYVMMTASLMSFLRINI